MQIIGVDLHARQQTVAMLSVEKGEIVEKTLQHEAKVVREFYSSLPGPVRVGGRSHWLEAGYTQNVAGFGWTNGVFLELLHESPPELIVRLQKE